jgi:hypothetical protein
VFSELIDLPDTVGEGPYLGLPQPVRANEPLRARKLIKYNGRFKVGIILTPQTI